MHKIGDLAKKYNLSRSTILYYDKLGLLKPTIREHNNYRLYDQQKVLRLGKIVRYRESGISLKDIKTLLEVDRKGITGILIERLDQIQQEIKDLKNQEKLVLDVLKEEVIMGTSPFSTSDRWTEMLVALGYAETDWLNWHREFELDDPQKHNQFLRALNMNDQEINDLLQMIKINEMPAKKT